MHILRTLRPLFLIALLVTCLDQLWKFMIQNVMVYSDSIPVVKGFFSLTLVYNKGAAFGIMQGNQNLFLFLPVLTVVLILILYTRSKEREGLVVPFGLLVGGTIGNFIDRLMYGHVVDFFDLFFRDWHWPAFNIADSCICFGVIILLFQIMGKKNVSSTS